MAGDSGLTVSETNPDQGEIFTAKVGADDCRSVELTVGASADPVTIDGKQTNEATKPVTKGKASFKVAIDQAGSYPIAAACVDPRQGDCDGGTYGGNDSGCGALGAVTVVIGGVIGGDVPPPDEGGLLPDVGADRMVTLLAVGGALLLLVGGGLVVAGRRRARG